MNHMYPKTFVAIGALALHVLTWVVGAADYIKPTTAVFPISGNVHPVGYFSVKIKFGHPYAERDLRIDSRSGLTWVRCRKRDAKALENRAVHCMHSACVSIQAGEIPTCGIQDRRCHYEIQYSDSSSSTEGLLFLKNVDVHDLSINDTAQNQPVAIGCGYSGPPSVDGVLGIGKGSAGILHQLQLSLGGDVLKNIFSHCFSSQGGGFLTLGYIPTKEIEIGWLTTRNNGRGGALYFWNETDYVISKPIQLLFDSGSPYTYFSSGLYDDLLTRIKAYLGNRLVAATNWTTSTNKLPVCWKVNTPETTDATVHFKPFYFNFQSDDPKEASSTFTMNPSSYLILTDKTTLCLGILDGGDGGIRNHHELAVIGAISMQEKWIVYDNDDEMNTRVGWVVDNCTKPPPQF